MDLSISIEIDRLLALTCGHGATAYGVIERDGLFAIGSEREGELILSTWYIIKYAQEDHPNEDIGRMRVVVRRFNNDYTYEIEPIEQDTSSSLTFTTRTRRFVAH